MIKTNELTKFTPKFKQYVFANILFTIVILSIVFSMAGNSNFFAMFLFFFIIVGLPIYAYIAVVYNHASFIINENSITINTGVMLKKSILIPFAKIQNIDCKQGIVMSMFGITNFDIWTSAQSQLNINNGNSANKPDGNIVLTPEDAEWLRSFITYSPNNKQ